MKRLSVLVFLIFALCSQVAFANQTYTNGLGVSLTIPDDYKIEEEENTPNKAVTYFINKYTHQDIDLCSNFYSDMPLNMTFYNLPDSKIDGLIYSIFGKLIINGDITNRPNYKKVTINDYPAVVTVVKSTIKGIPITTVIYYIMKNKKMVCLMYSAPTNSLNSFVPIIRTTINSIKID